MAYRNRVVLIILLLSVSIKPLPVYAVDTSSPTNTALIPLIIPGAQLTPLLGANPLKLSLFSCSSGRIRVIPFQVDEITSDGSFISLGDKASTETDELPRLLDETDLLVFMLRDAGESCPDEHLKRSQGKLIKISASAAYLKEPATVYALIGESALLPDKPGIQYDAFSHVVSTEAYTWGYLPDRPVQYTRMELRDLRGRENEDVLDRLKIHVNARILGELVSIRLDETDIKSKLTAWRTGPVRLVRQIEGEIPIVPGFKVRFNVNFYHYPRLMRAEVRFRTNAAATSFVSSLDLTIANDFIDLRGITLSTSAVPQGVLVNGQMVEQERLVSLGNEPWFMMSGLGINQITVVDLDKRLEGLSGQRALFLDDATAKVLPEEFTGGLPTLGYQLVGWEKIEPAWYTFAANIAMLPSFPEGGGTGFYKVLRGPIRIETTLIHNIVFPTNP